MNKGKGKGEEKGSKGKGKAELEKGKGKGKAAPQYESCWTCGGAHFSRDCPKGAESPGANRSLSSIREISLKLDDEHREEDKNKQKAEYEQYKEVQEDCITSEKATETQRTRKRDNYKINLKTNQAKKLCEGYKHAPRIDIATV